MTWLLLLDQRQTWISEAAWKDFPTLAFAVTSPWLTGNPGQSHIFFQNAFEHNLSVAHLHFHSVIYCNASVLDGWLEGYPVRKKSCNSNPEGLYGRTVDDLARPGVISGKTDRLSVSRKIAEAAVVSFHRHTASNTTSHNFHSDPACRQSVCVGLHDNEFIHSK